MKKNIRNRLLLLLIFAIYVLGGSFLVYPTLSDLYVRYAAEYEIDTYASKIKRIPEEEILEMELEAQKYNENLSNENGIVSFDSLLQQNDAELESADQENSEKASICSYDDLLSVTEAIGYLEIPKIDIYLPIYHGLGEKVLERGIGHMPESSLPVGGSSTHCVLSGHTGLPSAKLLTRLDSMETGDLFFIHTLDKTLAYEVDQIKVVLPEETGDIKITTGKDYTTILTCTPYGINSHRLLVRGVRTEYYPPEEEQAEAIQNEKKLSPESIKILFYTVYITIIVIVILLILFLPGKKSKNRKE